MSCRKEMEKTKTEIQAFELGPRWLADPGKEIMKQSQSRSGRESFRERMRKWPLSGKHA